MSKVLKIMMSALLLLVATTAGAQDDVEYRMELGVGANLTTYHGDLSSGLFSNMQPGGTVIFRAIINPRSAVRISAMVSKLKGDVGKAGTVFPDITEKKFSFSNTLGDLSVAYEYNFWPYGTGRDYRGAKRITPFITMGLGLTYAHCKEGTYDYSQGHSESGEYTPQYNSSKSIITGNVPIGVGVKYKIGARTNLSLDWQMHISFSDNLDGMDDPYRIKSSGLFKNTDCYSTLTLGLTYSLSPKCSTCHKDR